MKRLEYEIFEYQERYYFFDYVNLILMEIDKEIYEGMLKAKLDKGAVPQSEFVNFLHINSIGIDDGEIFRQIDRRKYDVACISFPTEHECQHACRGYQCAVACVNVLAFFPHIVNDTHIIGQTGIVLRIVADAHGVA